MALVMPAKTVSDAAVDYSYQQPNANIDDYYASAVKATVGKRGQTIVPENPQAAKAGERVHSEANGFTDVNEKLANAWLTISTELLSDQQDAWLHKSIDKAQRYLMALYDVDEYRNFITSYLMILRNNSAALQQKPAARQVLSRALTAYMQSTRTTQDRMQFIRTLRAVGISPIGA